MSTKNERFQNAWHSYERKNDRLPTSARQAVEWAVAHGFLDLPRIDPYDVLAGEMAQALREEYRTDERGFRVRFGRCWGLRLTNTWKRHLRSAVNK